MAVRTEPLRGLWVRIILADDHELVRETLRLYIERSWPDADVVECADFPTALAAAQEGETPDVVILDLNMPGMNGLSGVGRMGEAVPGVPVVVLSGAVQRENILEALKLGASGFLPKTISAKAMIKALDLVIAGERYVPSLLLEDGEEPIKTETERPVGTGLDAVEAERLESLTPRETEILKLLTGGFTNKDIARQLDLQEITVKVHLKHVYRKLQVSNRTQAANLALRAGME